MMPIDETDNGVEIISLSESREDSPHISSDVSKMESLNDEDDEDMDETLGERLWGLTEMFPESVRDGVWALVASSASGVKRLYGFSRSACWVFFSSSAILVAPVIFEMERLQMEEMQKQQQRQILLGPSAAMSPGLGPPR